MSDEKRELDDLQKEMTRLDAELLAVLEKRASASKRAGELRKDQPATLPLSEMAAVRGLVEGSSGVLPEWALRAIFREVMAACVSLELPVKVACVGPEGNGSHAAARVRFGEGANVMIVADPNAALAAVAARQCEFAVVPYETQAEGPVQATVLALIEHELKVLEVIDAEVTGGPLTPGRVAAGQESTRSKARHAIVGARPGGRSGHDLTAIAFSVNDEPGSLLGVLQKLADRGINLTKIQSRPTRGEGWSYLFFMEFVGHATDRSAVSAMEDVKKLTKFWRILGSYPVP